MVGGGGEALWVPELGVGVGEGIQGSLKTEGEGGRVVLHLPGGIWG